ncbi:MAG TPA: S9 family peptidase, partial [Chryseobacterium sp.]|nr:S9 family peptidase [Chryseobacterium sp.]
MKLTTLFASFSLFFIQLINAQNIVGSWKGDIDVQGMKLPFILNIKKDGNSYSSTIDSPKQGAKDIPVDKTDFTDGELSFEQQALGASY